MRYAPNGPYPGTMTIQNGRATKGTDAQAVDTYTTWLAASNPWSIPVMAGAPLTQTNAPAATPIRVDVWLPAYCQHVAIRMLCTGQGYVDFVPYCDAWSLRIPVSADDGGAGALDNYTVVDSDAPVAPAVVASHTQDRAINVTTPQSSPLLAEVRVSLVNATGSTLKVWALQFIPLLPLETAELVA